MRAGSYVWQSEDDLPAPATLRPVGDALTAAEALRRVGGGEFLLYEGDYRNALQLLRAMARRLEPRSLNHPPVGAPDQPAQLAAAFRQERRHRQEARETLGRVLVALDPAYRLRLRRSPDVSEACLQVWGPSEKDTVVSLKTLLGMRGASEWRRKGLAVPGLVGSLTPFFGVFTPTRAEYVELLAEVDARGKRVFDIGTGSGVLSFVLLQRGACAAVGTDVEPRAVACATENARRLGLERRFTAIEADLFPPGRAELVVCNPPWIPEVPKNRFDRAVFDEANRCLLGFLEGLRDHLEPSGEGLLLLSDLAVRLGLRPAGWLEARFEQFGLEVRRQTSTPARHGRTTDREDPLHAARGWEVTTLYSLVGATNHGGPQGPSTSSC